MSSESFSAGRASSSYRAVAFFNSEKGGMSLFVVNRSDSEELDFIVEAATGKRSGTQSANWRDSEEVQTGTVQPGEFETIHDVADEEDFRQYRALVRGDGKYVVAFGEPTGEAETGGGGEQEPGIYVTYDPVTDRLTITSVGGIIDFTDTFYIDYFVTSGDSYLDAEIVRDENWEPILPYTMVQPMDPYYSYVIESADVITVNYWGLWWVAWQGQEETLTRLDFYSDPTAETLQGSWEGELAIPPAVGTLHNIEYVAETDTLSFDIEGIEYAVSDPENESDPNLVEVIFDPSDDSDGGDDGGYNTTGIVYEGGYVVVPGLFAGLFGNPENFPELFSVYDIAVRDGDGNSRAFHEGLIELTPTLLPPSVTQVQYAIYEVGSRAFVVYGDNLHLVGTVKVTDGLGAEREYTEFETHEDGTLVVRDDEGLAGFEIVTLELRDLLDVVVVEETVIDSPLGFPSEVVASSSADGTLTLTGNQLTYLDRLDIYVDAFEQPVELLGVYFNYQNPAGAGVSQGNNTIGSGISSITVDEWSDTTITLTNTDWAGATLVRSMTAYSPLGEILLEQDLTSQAVAIPGTPPEPEVTVNNFEPGAAVITGEIRYLSAHVLTGLILTGDEGDTGQVGYGAAQSFAITTSLVINGMGDSSIGDYLTGIDWLDDTDTIRLSWVGNERLTVWARISSAQTIPMPGTLRIDGEGFDNVDRFEVEMLSAHPPTNVVFYNPTGPNAGLNDPGVDITFWIDTEADLTHDVWLQYGRHDLLGVKAYGVDGEEYVDFSFSPSIAMEFVVADTDLVYDEPSDTVTVTFNNADISNGVRFVSNGPEEAQSFLIDGNATIVDNVLTIPNASVLIDTWIDSLYVYRQDNIDVIPTPSPIGIYPGPRVVF